MKTLFKYLLFCCLILSGKELVCQTKSKPLFTFGVMADVQYADRDDHGTRHYRASLKKLEEAIAGFNAAKPEFVVNLGDFINDNYKSFDTLTAIAAKLNMPLFHVLGNHDFEVDTAEKNKILPALKLKKDYYSFVKSNWRFVFLNGSDISLIGNQPSTPEYKEAKEIFDKLKSEGAAAAKPWNGTLGDKQLSWLKNEIALAAKNKEQVILLCHFPLYPDLSPQILWKADDIRAVVEGSGNVKAYLNGHVHVSQYFFKNGVHYVSFKGMVEKDENAFAIISVFSDHLEIKGYGKEVDRILR